MKYLLVDFGASYIKTILFDRKYDTFSDKKYYDSPFLRNPSTTKTELMTILSGIIKETPCDSVVICTILGGHYDGETYHSWKSNKTGCKNYCMISGLFSDSPTFHIHEHHRNFTESTKYQSGLGVLGYINNIPVRSSLGDTYCAINSISLEPDDVGINMGTGSQVFYTKDYNTIVQMYIPSGRAFFVFQNFFQEFGFDMFSYMSTISKDDVINSTLDIDLKVFSSAHNFVRGGSISPILEHTFNKNNFVSSIIREYTLQYRQFIPSRTKRIHLMGGILSKINCLTDVFKHYYSEMDILSHNYSIENTHMGMSKLIKKYL